MNSDRVDTGAVGASDFVQHMPERRPQHPEAGYDGALMEGCAIPFLFVLGALFGAVALVRLIARVFA